MKKAKHPIPAIEHQTLNEPAGEGWCFADGETG